MAQPLVCFARQQLLRHSCKTGRKHILESAGCRLHRGSCGYSTEKGGSKVLSHSTILLQDGLDIQELPLVIRRMEPREFPFTTAMYTGECLRKVTEQDEAFRHQLRDSVTLRQVFTLLEVPGDKVTAYSAAFALQRLCNLQQSRDEIQSFVRKAVLNELCETVTRDIETLTNDTVVNLVKCYLISGHYESRHVDKINEDVERRIGDGAFTINEICSLIDLLSSFTAGDRELVNNLWIHLGVRFGEFNENSLPVVYRSVKNLPLSQRYLWKLIDKRVVYVWWKLDARDVSLVMQRMTLGNHFNGTVFVLVGKWLLLNIHEVNDAHLKDIVAAFNHFNFSDPNLMKALERYVSAKVSKMDKTVVAMVMEYCRKRKCVSPKILDAVAHDFQENGHSYKAHEILNVLRPYGHLNYVPRNATQLFLTIEEVLTKNFGDFDPASIIELLTSFVYIERFPVNFLKNIFTPHFLSKVKLIPHAPVRQQTGRHLMELQAAILLEFPKQYIKPVDGDSLGIALTWLERKTYKLHLAVSKVLSRLVGSGNFYEIEVPRNTPHIIDFQINLDKNRKPMKATRDSLEPEDTRLALVSIMPEHTCVNTKHLTGEQALKKRHLECLGYIVVSISYDRFMLRCRDQAEQVTYLRQLLSDHIQFSDKKDTDLGS